MRKLLIAVFVLFTTIGFSQNPAYNAGSITATVSGTTISVSTTTMPNKQNLLIQTCRYRWYYYQPNFGFKQGTAFYCPTLSATTASFTRPVGSVGKTLYIYKEVKWQPVSGTVTIGTLPIALTINN